MDRERLIKLRDLYRNALLDDVIPWWQSRFIDREYGGFLTYRDADGSLLSTDKPVWILGRIIWMWSRLYNVVEKRPEWLAVARHGADFMLKHAFDRDGRMFFRLTRDGRPIQKRRYLYSEVFGTMALAELSRAERSEELRRRARNLYRLMLKYRSTPGLLSPKYIPETRALRSHAAVMSLVGASQVIRDADPDPFYDEIIQQAIDDVFRYFVKPEKRCLLECVLPDGHILDEPEGRTVNPGHAIETCWFILEEMRRWRDANVLARTLEVLEWSLEIGWDAEYGGILYFVDCDGKPAEPYEHELKLWWPHVEALYACLLAYHMTGDAKWSQWYERVHEWTFAHFPDREHGEWFGYLRRDGTVSSPVKGNTWKGPFHVPRTLLNCWRLLEEMLK